MIPFYFINTMIQFNELRILPDSSRLVIDVSVQDLDYYDNIFIDSIIIDNQETYSPNGPSSKPVYIYTAEEDTIKVYSIPDCDSCRPVMTEDESYCLLSNQGKVKRVSLVLGPNDLVLDKKILFVYVKVKGYPNPDTPCGMDNSISMGVTFNLAPLYCNSIHYMKEVENNCNIPKSFIDFVLRFKAFELSIKSGHYTQAIKFWDILIKDRLCNINQICGCDYGTCC